MFLPRIIPILLLKNHGLVKTVNFKSPKYIGDPINAVHIFNDLKADELIFLDILASSQKRSIDVSVVRDIGDEAFMPFGVGGGISNLDQIENILKAGAEKVILNTNAVIRPQIIEEAAKYFGSQSIVISIDVKKNIWGRYETWVLNGSLNKKLDPVVVAKNFEEMGAGEVIIQSIDRDGTMVGYDLDLVQKVADTISIPVVACGGAGSLIHFKECYCVGHAHAMAAGSFFVYHGPRKAVLISYPSKLEIQQLFCEGK